jgi:hypothetical protein
MRVAKMPTLHGGKITHSKAASTYTKIFKQGFFSMKERLWHDTKVLKD